MFFLELYYYIDANNKANLLSMNKSYPLILPNLSDKYVF